MNTSEHLPITEEKVDQLLSTFFKTQLPKAFPPPPSVSSGTTVPSTVVNQNGSRKPSNVASSRMSLAVSVALILGGCFFLSGVFNHSGDTKHNYGPGGTPTASPNSINKIVHPKNALPKSPGPNP